MHRLSVVVVAVAFAVLALGCESELERRYREAAEEEDRMNVEFEQTLNEVKAAAARADKTDPAGIISVIEKFEELQKEATGVHPNLQEELRNNLVRWNNNYLRLAQDKYNETVAAANKKVDIQDYQGAIAEMNKFPESLTQRGPFQDKVDKYKEAIKAFARAPQEAHDAVKEADDFVKEKEFEKALERCDQFFRMMGRTKSPAVYIVMNKHISILEELIDGMIRNGEYDKALDRISHYGTVYASQAHRDFLEEKAREIEEKKAGSGK